MTVLVDEVNDLILELQVLARSVDHDNDRVFGQLRGSFHEFDAIVAKAVALRGRVGVLADLYDAGFAAHGAGVTADRCPMTRPDHRAAWEQGHYEARAKEWSR